METKYSSHAILYSYVIMLFATFDVIVSVCTKSSPVVDFRLNSSEIFALKLFLYKPTSKHEDIS